MLQNCYTLLPNVFHSCVTTGNKKVAMADLTADDLESNVWARLFGGVVGRAVEKYKLGQ